MLPSSSSSSSPSPSALMAAGEMAGERPTLPLLLGASVIDPKLDDVASAVALTPAVVGSSSSLPKSSPSAVELPSARMVLRIRSQ